MHRGAARRVAGQLLVRRCGRGHDRAARARGGRGGLRRRRDRLHQYARRWRHRGARGRAWRACLRFRRHNFVEEPAGRRCRSGAGARVGRAVSETADARRRGAVAGLGDACDLNAERPSVRVWFHRETWMRILMLNPNTTRSVTDILLHAAEAVAAPGTEIVPLTAPRGVPYIATRAEAQIGGAVALEMIAEHQNGIDAVIIAAFGDPGLLGARELFDIPIVGMAEAPMLTACMLGRRFSIVTFARALGPWYEDCVEMH